jgi:hypothetical protein
VLVVVGHSVCLQRLHLHEVSVHKEAAAPAASLICALLSSSRGDLDCAVCLSLAALHVCCALLCCRLVSTSRCSWLRVPCTSGWGCGCREHPTQACRSR